MNETLKKLHEQLAAKNARVKELAELDAPSEEQAAELKSADAEAEQFVVAIKAETERLEAVKRAQTRAAFLDAVATQVPPSDAEPRETVDVIPTHSTVKSFTGSAPDAARKAYRFGRWVLGGLLGHETSREYCLKAGLAFKAQAENVNTSGGFLVPTEFANDIINLMTQYGVIRKYARVRRMTRDQMQVPRATSEITAYWVGENATITDSTRAYDQVNLVTKKLAALVLASNEWSEDSIIDVADDLANSIAQAFAKAEDQAAFLGDGTSTYGKIEGIIPRFQRTVTDAGGTWTTDAHKIYNSSIVVAAGNAFSEVTLGNLHSVRGGVAALKNTQNNVWFCNSSFYYAVMERLAAAAGGATVGDIANFQAGATPTLLGRAVVFTEVMISQEANSGVPLVYGDLGLATTLGDRKEMTLARSTEYGFATDQLAIRAITRLDFVPHDLGTASSTAASRVRGPVAELALANS